MAYRVLPHPRRQARVKVHVFIPCLVEHVLPGIGQATLTVLRKAGQEPVVPAGQTCCGQFAYKRGRPDLTVPLAKRFIARFEIAAAVVCPSGSCTAMVRRYPELFAPGDPWRDRAQRLAGRTFELGQYLVDRLGITDLGARLPGRAALHESCQVTRVLGAGEATRTLLGKVAGLELAPLGPARGLLRLRRRLFPGLSGTRPGHRLGQGGRHRGQRRHDRHLRRAELPAQHRLGPGQAGIGHPAPAPGRGPGRRNGMTRASYDFGQAAAQSLADQELQAVLAKAMAHIRALRQGTVEKLPDFAARRDRAKAVRERTLAELPDLLETLEANVTAAGGTVHWATDGLAAASLVTELLASRGVRLAVKGKSMIGEEIGLRQALGAAGIEAVETDLGEYIIQLAGHAPSHIISPALHLSRGQVSDLFARTLGRTGEDSAAMTRVAREALRRKFLAADAGITGANIAVAETGTIVLLENEGNIRLSTTCPPVVVALMSLEKVVASLADAATVLDILPLAATGQVLPVHLSFLTGPRRPGETDGPREFHLVILDNGRSALLGDPALRDILRCIRCGACLNVCPVYQRLGGHPYGSVYPGPMGSVLSPLLAHAPGDPRQPFACTHCRACAAACPVGIDHPALLQELRQRLAAGTTDPAVALFAGLARHPLFFSGAAGLARALDPHLTRCARLAPGSRLGRYLRGRRFPGLTRPFSRRHGNKGGRP